MVLGLALGASAIGGWVALTGQLDLPAVLFGMAVLCWVAGFDIIYACQDVHFDRQAGLFSIPACRGIAGGLRFSRLLHALTILFLLAVGMLTPFVGWGYWSAVTLTTGMLVYEHRLVSPTDLSRVNAAFFLVNGGISLGVFLLILLDKSLR
jgi:4-hydroxybenzoate polyprenyltransferase